MFWCNCECLASWYKIIPSNEKELASVIARRALVRASCDQSVADDWGSASGGAADFVQEKDTFSGKINFVSTVIPRTSGVAKGIGEDLEGHVPLKIWKLFSWIINSYSRLIIDGAR